MKEISLPEWYKESNSAMERWGKEANPSRSKSTVRKALASIGDVLARELSGSLVQESWLSHIEPRARLIGIMGLLFTATLLHDLMPLIGLFTLLCIALVSVRIPLKRIARVWLGVPLFSLGIVLPATLNLVTDGDAVFTLWHLGKGAHLWHWQLPEMITITDAGIFIAARFLLRTLDCITLSFLLVSSADSSVLVSSLRRLGMPKIFGMVLAVMQRYLAVLLRAAEEIHLARLSRPSGDGSIRNEHRWVAAGMGILFKRTYRLSDEIGLAMTSRGYDGDLQIGHRTVWRLCDTLWLIGMAVLIVGILAVDRMGLM